MSQRTDVHRRRAGAAAPIAQTRHATRTRPSPMTTRPVLGLALVCGAVAACSTGGNVTTANAPVPGPTPVVVQQPEKRPPSTARTLGIDTTRPATVTATPVPARLDSLVRESDVRFVLSSLADDSMQGRGTGTPGSLRAARFIAAQMQAAGLEPAGDSGFFQRVPVAVLARTVRMRSGRDTTLLRPTLLASFAALDSAPAAQRRPAYNVLGILRGTDSTLRDSVVLVDAHYDHLGIGRPVNGDSIYNGADDDASGTTAVIEIAKALASGARPKRTVIFAATTGEEVGLLGTRWLIQHPPVPFSHIESNLEIEMIGRPDSLAGGRGRAWLTGYDRSTMGAMFAAAGLPIVPDQRPDQRFFERSDNIAFARAGIPAHTLSTYNMHTDYHEPSDEVSRIDFPHMTTVIRAGAGAVWLLANGDAPRWNIGGRPSN